MKKFVITETTLFTIRGVSFKFPKVLLWIYAAALIWAIILALLRR